MNAVWRSLNREQTGYFLSIMCMGITCKDKTFDLYFWPEFLHEPQLKKLKNISSFFIFPAAVIYDCFVERFSFH